MARPSVTEQDDCWLLPLAGWRVDRLRVDHTLGIEFLEPPTHSPLDHDAYELTIGTRFVYETPRGRHELDTGVAEDGGGRSALGPVLDLLGRSVEEARMLRSGGLEVRFDAGERLLVEPDADFEAWELRGPVGFLVVCLPGGSEPEIWAGADATFSWSTGA